MATRTFRASCKMAFRRIIGLTGTIASGKSNALLVLHELGAVTVDADTEAHATYKQGTQCYTKIVTTFGDGVLGMDGEIDRRRLGSIVFDDDHKMQALNSIVWPAVRARVVARLDELAIERNATSPLLPLIGVIEAALLFESGWSLELDEVWLCATDDDEAVRRAALRPGMNEVEARKRLDLQRRGGIPAAERARRASIVIDTSGPKDRTRATIAGHWHELIARLQQVDPV